MSSWKLSKYISRESCNMLGYIILLILFYNVFAIVRRKIECPSVPWITCIINVVLSIPHMLKIGPWSKSVSMPEMLKTCMQTTGLTDTGDKEGKFLERYEIARKKAFATTPFKYSPLGYIGVQTSMKVRLTCQLRFHDYMKEHPEIRDLKMKDPIFIIGFPRTGTTFLHELLGIHPDVRMHYSWEQFDPIPSTHDTSLIAHTADRKKRYEQNKGAFNLFLAYAGDRIQSVHRIGYDESEECTTPCAMDLPWMISTIPFIVFAAQELADMGAGQAFQTYRNFLKLLQWQSEDRRDADFTWMLKCPFHLPYLTELLNEFPNSTVVWTHRNPVDCVASACSLYETLMLFNFEPSSIDKEKLGKGVLDYTRVCLDKAFASIKKAGPNAKIVHIRYADNVKSPKKNCSDICEKV